MSQPFSSPSLSLPPPASTPNLVSFAVSVSPSVGLDYRSCLCQPPPTLVVVFLLRNNKDEEGLRRESWEREINVDRERFAVILGKGWFRFFRWWGGESSGGGGGVDRRRKRKWKWAWWLMVQDVEEEMMRWWWWWRLWLVGEGDEREREKREGAAVDGEFEWREWEFFF